MNFNQQINFSNSPQGYNYPNNIERYNPDEGPIGKADYNVPGPFIIKESFTPYPQLFSYLDNYICSNCEVPLEMFATFSEIEVKNCKFEIDIFDFFYYDSHIGPMAEMWFRDPETVVEGTGDITLKFKIGINDEFKEITLTNMEIKGTLKMIPNEELEWVIGVNSSQLFNSLRLFIEQYESLVKNVGITNEEDHLKFNSLKYYFIQIHEKAENEMLEFNRRYNSPDEVPSNFGNVYENVNVLG
jgi:hypothetical protein